MEARLTPVERLVAGDGARSATPVDVLAIAALAYVGLPMLVFLASWLRPVFALTTLGLAAIAVRAALGNSKINWHIPHRVGVVISVVTAGAAWAALGGGSHFAYANPDWVVRDAVLGDLTYTDWPPSYGYRDGAHYLLRSAIGFFLPIAAAGKLLGTVWLPWVVYAWTALGTIIFLLLLPLPERPGWRLLGALSIVILFSGMDILGILILHGQWPIFPLRLEWWARFSYPSLSGQLLWGPNHALALWIAAAVFYRHWKHPDFLAYASLFLPASILVSPFVLPALLPFFLLCLADRWRSGTLRQTLPQAGVIALGLLFTALFSSLLLLDIDAIPVRHVVQEALGQPVDRDGSFIGDYALFVLAEFGILCLLLFPLLRHSLGIAAISAAVLLVLPFVFFGPSNDLQLRVSTPPLVFLAIFCLRQMVTDAGRLTARHGALALALIVGAYTPISELWRTLVLRRIPADYTRTLTDTQKGHLAPHYVGRLDNRLLIALLREPQPVPDREARISSAAVAR